MYRKVEPTITLPENFMFSFGGKLSEGNRWVMMAQVIPWSEFEQEYAQNFSEEIGAPAKTFRMALGALIIKERLGTSDRETVEQIRENPYLQYFLGLESYSNERPFDASMLVYFRQRISVNLVNKVNREMVKRMREAIAPQDAEKKSEEEEKGLKENRGKLSLDATCAPADITYPNDLGLLNKARQQTEEILDVLYQSLRENLKIKPRTYRKIARKNYLKVAKKRRPSRQERRQAIGKQLRYIARNSSHIEQLIKSGASLEQLSKRQSKILLVVAEVYRQQLWMFDNKMPRIEHRIVSLTQPHIRPIIRGKAGNSVEFGAKLSASCYENYVFLDNLSWENFNESQHLKAQVENFKSFTGYYPKSVHVDQIYRTRENRAWCKERGIRISGSPLGRPPAYISPEEKKQAQLDERTRNCIEGKFGQAKRRFSLNRVMSKLSQTSQTSIAITFLVINLSTLLRTVFSVFYTYS